MRHERDDSTLSPKALTVFFTMRTNLAMVDAFFCRAKLEESDYDGNDLGYLDVNEQKNIHDQCVTTIAVALLYQILENYQTLKQIKPTLKDPGLEDFLEDLESRGEFINGMRLIRNGVFHVNVYKLQDQRSVDSYYEVCNQCGSVFHVMKKLRELFYDFTGKIFSDKLQIWPADLYENRYRLYAEWKERMEASLDSFGDNQ